MAVCDIEALFKAWDEDGTIIEPFREWRGSHMRKHREFAGITQKEFGNRIGLTQPSYAKLEQATLWGSALAPIAEILQVPEDMLHNSKTARAFFSRDGGMTFVRLLEGVMAEASEGEGQKNSVLPVRYVQDRMNAEISRYPVEGRAEIVLKFLANPLANDLDQTTKRWLENVLELGQGALADAQFYKDKGVARSHLRTQVRHHFLSNVERLLAERRWTPADLAMNSGLKFSEVVDPDSGYLLFQPLTSRQIAAVSVALGMDYSLLTMENGTDLRRESADAFRDLPESVRGFIGWLYQTVTDGSEGKPNHGALAVRAALPWIRAMLERVQIDADKNPAIAEAMAMVYQAYTHPDGRIT